MQSVQLKLSKFEDENVALKMQILDLSRKNRTPDESKVKSHNADEQMKVLAEENEALRKGLHEILESLQNKNGMEIIVFQRYL